MAARLTLFDGSTRTVQRVPQILNTVSLALFIASCVAIAILRTRRQAATTDGGTSFPDYCRVLLFNGLVAAIFAVVGYSGSTAFPRWRL